MLLALLPPDPAVPPPERSPAALFSTWESGRVDGGGVYAWFSVPASSAAVYAVLADDAAMHAWIPHLSRSDVIERGDRCNRVAFEVPSPVGTVAYMLQRCHADGAVWWTKAEGDRFEAIEGSYRLTETPGGTLVRYWSHVVASVPVPLAVQEEVARVGLGDLVAGLRAEVARRSP